MPTWAARHRAGVLLATGLLTILGINAAFTLPAGTYPEAIFPRIVIIARVGTFEPRDMVVAVTRPLEEDLSGVIDLRRIQSRTVRGATELSLDFRSGADMQFALQQVQGRLAVLQPELPPGVHILAERLTPSVFPMMQFELTGGDPMLLRDLAQYTIRPRLARLPDVGEVTVQGGLVREVSVVLDPARLVATYRCQGSGGPDPRRQYGRGDRSGRSGVSPAQCDRFRSRGDRRCGGRPRGKTGPRLPGAGVRPGQRPYGAEDQFLLATGNGQPAALINVSRQPAGNILRSSVRSLRHATPCGSSSPPT